MSKCKYNAALIGTGRIGFTLGFDSKREQPASHAMALKENRIYLVIILIFLQLQRLIS